MKSDRKIKTEKAPTKVKAAKGVRQAALKTNGKHPLTSYEHIPIGIVECSLDGKYMDVNEEFCRITGYTRSALLQRRIQDLTYEDDYVLDMKLHDELVAKKIPFYRLEKRYMRKDGGSIWVELTRSLVRDTEGKPLYTIGVVLDISDRKDVEKVLRESVERLRLATGAAHMFMWEWDFQGQSYTLADNFEKVLGFSAGLLPRNDFGTVWALSPKEDVQRLSEEFEQAVANQRDLHALPYRVINPENGQIVWLEVSAKIMYDREGLPQRMFGVAQNITASKNAQDQIAIISRMPEENPNPVMRLTPDGKVLYANGPSRAMLESWQLQGNQTIPDNLQQHVAEAFAFGSKKEIEITQNGRVFSCTLAPIREAGYVNFYGSDITPRKQAEEKLRESEERFTLFMQHLPGLAWIKDVQGRYIYANTTAEKAFGTPREKLYGKTDEEIFPPKTAAQFKNNDESALREAEGVQVVETLAHEDGVLHHSLVTKFPMPGIDGNPTLIGGTAFDITERLRTEEALRESEERFSAILRQATAGIVRKDAEGRLVFVNQAFCNMLGYTEAELLGKTTWEFMHQDDVEENKKLYDRLMMQGIPFNLERRLLREDGSVIWLDASVSPIMDAEGKPQSSVAVEVDITARKQAEEALQQLNLQLEDTVLRRTDKLRAVNQTLREEIAERKRVEEALRQSEETARTSEEKLRTLFDLLPVGISFLNPQGQILQMNSALSEIMKLPREQLLTQPNKSRNYIRADGTPRLPAEFASARALAEGTTVYNVETGIVLENREVIWTSVSAAPVDVADVGVVVVTVDITDSKRAEQALQESYKRLRILSQRLVEVQEDERRALARELHDRVGQTLAALNINLIIVNSQLSPEVSQQIGTRLNDSMKLVAETIALVRDVMTDLRPAVLDDYGLQAAIESHLAQFASRYNIKAKFEKPDPPLPRLGPSLEMTFLRIAQEALMNAARHAQADQVNLSLRQEEDKVCLTIQDNGIGIASRQEANRPGSHGLNIMRERAAAFDGDLKVRSMPGRGTTIEVSIPFKRAGETEASEEKDV